MKTSSNPPQKPKQLSYNSPAETLFGKKPKNLTLSLQLNLKLFNYEPHFKFAIAYPEGSQLKPPAQGHPSARTGHKNTSVYYQLETFTWISIDSKAGSVLKKEVLFFLAAAVLLALY